MEREKEREEEQFPKLSATATTTDGAFSLNFRKANILNFGSRKYRHSRTLCGETSVASPPPDFPRATECRRERETADICQLTAQRKRERERERERERGTGGTPRQRCLTFCPPACWRGENDQGKKARKIEKLGTSHDFPVILKRKEKKYVRILVCYHVYS